MCSPGNRMVHTNGFISEGQYRNLRGGIVIIHTLSQTHSRRRFSAVADWGEHGENEENAPLARRWEDPGNAPCVIPVHSCPVLHLSCSLTFQFYAGGQACFNSEDPGGGWSGAGPSPQGSQAKGPLMGFGSKHWKILGNALRRPDFA